MSEIAVSESPATATGCPLASAPLTSMQAGMWLINHAYPGKPALNITIAARLHGPLDTRILSESIEIVVARHAPLRSRFRMESGALVQHANPADSVALSMVDISAEPEAKRESQAQVVASDFVLKFIDLKTDPPFGALLIRVSPEDHILVFRVHHISIDGISVQLLRGEVFEAYAALCEGRPSSLKPVKRSYMELVTENEQKRRDEPDTRGMAYWLRQLSGLPDTSIFPRDRPVPASQEFRAFRTSVFFPNRVLRKVKQIAAEEHATPFSVLLAGFQALLARLSGQDVVVTGVPVAGRRTTDSMALIGCFINNIVVRARVSETITFRELVRSSKMTVMDGLMHRDVAYGDLVQALRPGRTGGSARLFDVIFQLLNQRVPELAAAGGISIGTYDIDHVGAPSEVSVACQIQGEQIECQGMFSLDTFTPDTARLVLGQFSVLLERSLEAPDSPVFAHSLITAAAAGLLPDPTASQDAPLFGSPVMSVLEQAVKRPEAIAVRWSGRSWTYAEFARDITIAAGSMAAKGVRSGTTVGLLGSKSYGMLVAKLAIMRAGGIVVLLDSDLPALRISAMLEAARATVLVTVARPGTTEATTAHAAMPEPVLVLGEDGSIAGDRGHGALSQLPEISGDDPAYVFFTSGTTGVPKAVLGTHKGIAHFIAWQSGMLGVRSSDRVSMLTALTFDPILREIFLPLCNGAVLTIPPPALAGGAALKWLDDEQVTVVHTVPSRSESWLIAQGSERPLSHVRAIFSAGEPLTETHVRLWRRRLNADAVIVNLYGPTETTMAKTAFVVQDPPSPGVQPIGTDFPNTQVLVLNSAGLLCGINEPGEILIRTPFMTLGYLNAPEEQAKRFIQNPFVTEPGDTVYRTGDLARYRHDGTVAILGRTDDQVKVRGVRVEPSEVNAVLQKHPMITNSAVISRQVGSSAELIAYVVSAGTIAEADVKSFLGARLPQAMVPSRVAFLEKLPLGTNGKLDRKALPEPSAAVTGKVEYSTPRRTVETRIAKIWADAMGIEEVGRDDNFFDLGGHSLLAAQVFDRIYRVFGRSLPMASLFEASTVANMATLLGDAGNRWTPLVPVRSTGTLPPLFCIHGAGGGIVQFHTLAKYLPADQPVYALEGRGLDGKSKPMTEITEMAQAYAAEMVRVQDSGPYFLAGTSMGGTVALEVARILLADGRNVGLVALIDSTPPRCANKFRLATFTAGLIDGLKEPVRQIGYAAYTIRGRSLPPRLVRRRAMILHFRAAHRHKASPVGVSAVLFRASDGDEVHLTKSHVEQWRHIVEGGLTVTEIKGSHRRGEASYMAEPQVAGLAAKLAAAITQSSYSRQ